MVTGPCPLAKTLFDNPKKGMHVVTCEGKEWEFHGLPFHLGFQAMILPQGEVI